MSSLEDFTSYFLRLDFAHMAAEDFYDFGNVLSLVLCRDAQLQAELFILRPGQGFPREHRHPDVDSYEFILSEHVPLLINGVDQSRVERRGPKLGTGNLGAMYHVGAEDWHGVGDVPKGGSFLSLQQWRNGRAPNSVGLNWEGAPVSENHRRLLRQPGAVWVKTVRKP